jgi:hypothetical protein
MAGARHCLKWLVLTHPLLAGVGRPLTVLIQLRKGRCTSIVQGHTRTAKNQTQQLFERSIRFG